MKNILRSLIIVGAGVGLSLSAQAVPTLWLMDGAASVQIVDGSAADLNPTAGVVGFTGAVGSNWTVNFTGGFTYPAVGSLEHAIMDTVSANMSVSAGTLVIAFSEVGFLPPGGTIEAHIGGTSNAGSVTYGTYFDAANTLFATTSQMSFFGPLNGPAFADSVDGEFVVAAGAPYSLTQVIQVTHTQGGITSFDAYLHVPDTGATILLLGSSLTALGLLGWKKRSR